MRSTQSLFLFVLLTLAGSAQAAPIKVRLSFIEALAPKDTTASVRFERDFKTAITLAKKALAPRLSSCGYELETKTGFYDAGDPLQAKERAEAAAKSGAWLLVGPRRSNHYLLLAKGAPQTPSVSLMASASEVEQLGPLHLSLSPSNAQMAEVAARAAADWKKAWNRRVEVSIISDDCLSCRDFAASFEPALAHHGFIIQKRILVSGESPKVEPILDLLRKAQPTVVLLPDYSKTASYLIANIQSKFPDILFVGGDGWGDSKFGFVQNGLKVEEARGITVRGFPPTPVGLRAFALGRQVADRALAKEMSGPSMAVLKVMDSTARLLCDHRPKTAFDFSRVFSKYGRSSYSAPWGVSVYSLKSGNIRFDHEQESRR